MAALSSILRSLEGNQLAFFCPGCKCTHKVNLDTGVSPHWTWNNSVTKPTFMPSLLIYHDQLAAISNPDELREQLRYKKNNPGYVLPTKRETLCHSWITDGLLIFLNDCKHHLAGQTVPMPEWTS